MAKQLDNFLRFIFYKIYRPILKIVYDYNTILSLLQLATFKQRRLISDLSFISKILNNHVDRPDISNLISILMLRPAISRIIRYSMCLHAKLTYKIFVTRSFLTLCSFPACIIFTRLLAYQLSQRVLSVKQMKK